MSDHQTTNEVTNEGTYGECVSNFDIPKGTLEEGYWIKRKIT